jgi:hypothetical protein
MYMTTCSRDMPHAEQLEHEARILLGHFISAFYKIQQSIQENTLVIQELSLIEIPVAKKDPETSVIISRIKKTFYEALESVQSVGIQNLKDMEAKAVDVSIALMATETVLTGIS